MGRIDMVLINKEHSVTAASKSRVALCLTSGIFLLSLAITVTYVDLVTIVTQMQIHMYNGSRYHKFLEREMSNIRTSMYLFNYTNVGAFVAGEDARLHLQEVGPFTYREIRVNTELQINDEGHEVRYTPAVSLEYALDQSVGLPEDINLTMPNLPMLGLSSKLSTFPYFTRLGWNMLTSRLNSKPFINVNAQDYMWGYKEPLVTLANTVMPGMVPMDKLGILDRLYDEKNKNDLVVGASDTDKMMVKTRNGYTKLQMTPSQDPMECAQCDTFENTYEGIGYPSPVLPETPVRIFRNGLCKLLEMEYHETRVFDGNVKGLVFNLSSRFYSMDKNPDNDGLLDLSECYYNLPIALSKAHFLDVDPQLYSKIEGMRPDPGEHNSYIVIEPTLAINVKTRFPIQMNLVLQDLSFNYETRSFSNMVLPIGYVDIKQTPLPDDTKFTLKKMYVIYPTVFLIMKIICPIAGIMLLVYSVLLVYSSARSEEKVEGISKNPSLKKPLMDDCIVK